MQTQTQARFRTRCCWWFGLAVLVVAAWCRPVAYSPGTSSAGAAETAAADPAGDPAPKLAHGLVPEQETEVEGINFFWLMVSGGWFMIPIGLMSLIALAAAIERTIGLRRSRIIPDPLVTELGQLSADQGSFDPRQAYRLCQQHGSSAAAVVRSMLMKIGRPHSEVEHAVAEASDREAERVYANVRWLELSASVAPLMGLIGTVWGMIVAFHDTTMLPSGINKAIFLAKGIYIALVTTLAGLIVAIPAAILAHYFESRVVALFHEIDELLFSLMPSVERYERGTRFHHLAEDQPSDDATYTGSATG
jgi:biopolymer transport protein ExbB